MLQKIETLEGNWKRFTFIEKGKTYEATAKIFEEGSEFGIDGGKISKLSIVKIEKGKRTACCNFDRGWDVKPTEEGAKAVFEELISNEN